MHNWQKGLRMECGGAGEGLQLRCRAGKLRKGVGRAADRLGEVCKCMFRWEGLG